MNTHNSRSRSLHHSLPLACVVLVAIISKTVAWIPPASIPSTTGRSSRSSILSSTILSSTKLAAVKTDEDLLPIVRDGIAEQGATEAWQACVQLLVDTPGLQLDDDEQKAEVLLAAALEWRGWARVSSALARKYMTPRPPDPIQLQTALQWLHEGPLGLTDGEMLQQAIQSCPTAYLVDPAAAYQQALATAPPPYRNAPDEFKTLLLEDPSVLKHNYNCRQDGNDGCNSECGTCWVSYGLQQKSKVQTERDLW